MKPDAVAKITGLSLPGVARFRRCVLQSLCAGAMLLSHVKAQTPPRAAMAAGADGCARAYSAARYGEAARCYGQVAEAAATSELLSEARRHQAEALVRAGDLQHAEEALRRGLKAMPEAAESLYLLGQVLERQNRPADSLAVYTQAATLRRPTVEDLRTVALDYVLLGDYADARHWLERALAADAGNAEAWYDLARVAMHDGRFADGETSLRRSLALRPNSAKTLDNLGVCLEAENDTDAAAEAYAGAVRVAATETHPSETPYVDYGRLLITRNRTATALPLLQRATEINPSSSDAFAELSRAASGTGDTATALRSMEEAVRLAPRNSRLHFQLGRLYRAAGMPERARQEFALSEALYGQSATE